MENSVPTFSILISTKNRIVSLLYTLHTLESLLVQPNVSCVVYDDGSTDGTNEQVRNQFPMVTVLRNEVSKGYLFCRNKMLSQTTADYAISLDDDAHFLSENPLEAIASAFENTPTCGVLAFRIFWGIVPPAHHVTPAVFEPVQGFVGCGHVWRMTAWHAIPNYPEWFSFYGEEEFASYQLLQNQYQIYYLPAVLVHHRVDVRQRRLQLDYQLRLRQSLRAGWYMFLLFYPLSVIPRKIAYSLWYQFKNKTLQGDYKATFALFQSFFDVLINFPKLLKQSNRFSMEDFKAMKQLPETNIYWKPEDEK